LARCGNRCGSAFGLTTSYDRTRRRVVGCGERSEPHRSAHGRRMW
jgi:hypothetical protein